jgi:hypothetical protein
MPFAGHRDSVSELVGDVIESAIENVLSKASVWVPSPSGHCRSSLKAPFDKLIEG